jgi:hypothetical protein
MIDDPPQLDPDETGAGSANGGSTSVLDKIKTRRTAAIGEEQWFNIPTWGGELKARFEVQERGEIEKQIRATQARLRGAGKKGASAVANDSDLNFLVKACDGVKAVDAETEAEEFLAQGFTLELAKMLDPKYPKGHPQEGETVVINDPKQLVAYLMAWNGVSIATFSQRVGRWMQDTTLPVEDPQ